ncbi:hypothetical protein LDENG_00243540, partial [Lucifuga dentata]
MAEKLDEETPLLSHQPTPAKNKIRNSRLFLAVFSAVLGNFSFGYSMVYSSPVLPRLQDPDMDPRLR